MSVSSIQGRTLSKQSKKCANINYYICIYPKIGSKSPSLLRSGIGCGLVCTSLYNGGHNGWCLAVAQTPTIMYAIVYALFIAYLTNLMRSFSNSILTSSIFLEVNYMKVYQKESIT